MPEEQLSAVQGLTVAVVAITVAQLLHWASFSQEKGSSGRGRQAVLSSSLE